MTTPAKKAPVRKRAASVAARREVRSEKGSVPKIKVTFRGTEFELTRDRIGNEKVFMRQQALSHFGTGETLAALLFDILGPVDSARWIDTMGPGDTLADAAAEFIKVLNKAGNVPNS